ncbi:hypothetical protein EIMP300_50900 [Escherichia coli]|uniref:4Fe-4S ferredoxin-type domain-containing protein n=1 Tax=Escherichia coli TaxID=562 RepID=A0A8S0FVI4_ECOLX|nr:hypothetical protein EIMP300_50900 [Escherichia coli]
MPQQLYWFSKGQQHDKATTHNIADCIECGACAWVCPSNIPLVQYFRQEKAEIAAIRQEEKRAAEAKARFEARQARLEREKTARLERHKSAAVQPAAKDKDAIAAALARVKEKQAQATQPIVIKAGERPDNRQFGLVQLLQHGKPVKRKPERNRQNCSKLTTLQPLLIHVKLPLKRLLPAPKHASWSSNRPMRSQNNRFDPRKAAVEAAIARAKARKLEQQQANAEPEQQVDPRKAAVEAAIARAKARKLEQQQANAEPEEQVDPRKAAVEAAIARAKARKLEQQQQANAEPEEQVDPRKAAASSKPLLPVPKHASWNSNRPMRSQNNRSIRAKLPSKRLLHAPKRASWNSNNRLMRNQKNRLIHAKPPSKLLLPVPKHASWNSNRLMQSQKNRLIRAKRQLLRLLPAFRPKKPPSKRL